MCFSSPEFRSINAAASISPCSATYDQPTLRLPGGAGSAMLYAMSGRTILFTMTTAGNCSYRKLDFVNATGFDGAVKTAWRRGGLSHVVTPLCVMIFDGETKRIVLDYIFAGVTLEQVVENTGFNLGVVGRQIPVVNPLNEASLTALRGPVLEKMKTIYPLACQMIWG